MTLKVKTLCGGMRQYAVARGGMWQNPLYSPQKRRAVAYGSGRGRTFVSAPTSAFDCYPAYVRNLSKRLEVDWRGGGVPCSFAEEQVIGSLGGADLAQKDATPETVGHQIATP